MYWIKKLYHSNHQYSTVNVHFLHFYQIFPIFSPPVKTMILLPKSTSKTLDLSHFQDTTFRFLRNSSKFITFPHQFLNFTWNSLKSEISNTSSAGTSTTNKSVSIASNVNSTKSILVISYALSVTCKYLILLLLITYTSPLSVLSCKSGYFKSPDNTRCFAFRYFEQKAHSLDFILCFL